MTFLCPFFQIFWKNHVNSSKYFGRIISVLPNSLITLETHINVHLRDSLSLSPIEAQCHCPQSRLNVIVPNQGSLSLSPIEAQCHCPQSRLNVIISQHRYLVKVPIQTCHCHATDTLTHIVHHTGIIVHAWINNLHCHMGHCPHCMHNFSHYKKCHRPNSHKHLCPH